jgi:hypothetical protein
VALLLVPTGSAIAFGPVWAVLCGACAAGWRWESDALLSLVWAAFAAEVLWATWRAHLVDMRWGAYIAARPLPPPGAALPGLPYTTPWSPLGRLLNGWQRLRRLPAERQGALLTLPVLPPLILLLSALVGWPMLVLSFAALSLSLIEWRFARRGQTTLALRAGLEIGLSWLAGHAAFGPLTWASFVLACCYALTYQGLLSLDDEHRPWPLGLLYGGQSAALVLLLLRQATWGAAAAGILLAPQLLLLSRPETDGWRTWYVRRAVPSVLAAMVIAAWAV